MRPGAMQPPGLAAYQNRSAARRRPLLIRAAADRLRAGRRKDLSQANRKAWAFFAAQPPGYRRTAIWYVVSAVKEETPPAAARDADSTRRCRPPHRDHYWHDDEIIRTELTSNVSTTWRRNRLHSRGSSLADWLTRLRSIAASTAHPRCPPGVP